MSSAVSNGQETIPTDEPAQIEQLLAILRSIQEARDRRKSPVPRNVHPKQHGGVRAELVVEPGLPAALRQGIFRHERTYTAVVRFSNAKQPDDRLPDAHGMAIKVLGVEGHKLLESERTATTQDFLLVDHPVFFVKNVADFIPLAHDYRRLMIGGILSKVRTGLKAALSRDYRFRLLRKVVAKRPNSPLEIQYWSTTPSRFGTAAMKFTLRPHLDSAPLVLPKTADKFRVALKEHLRQREARFDFLVQIQGDPVTMPIEDPTIEWDESETPFQKVGRLRIPRQDFDSPEQLAFAENLSFTPWHALADHQPLGGINRARKVVYEVMAERRRELNHASRREPTVDEVRAMWPLSA